jgi:hypothetical protein
MNNAQWWANKLESAGRQTIAPRTDPTPPMPPSQQPMQAMPTFQPQATTKAQYANSTDSCPDCGSGNYMSPSNTVAKRCYDCGYPVQQSGSRYGSLSGARVDGAAKAATGNDATNNWNPQGIVGRIDG